MAQGGEKWCENQRKKIVEKQKMAENKNGGKKAAEKIKKNIG